MPRVAVEYRDAQPLSMRTFGEKIEEVLLFQIGSQQKQISTWHGEMRMGKRQLIVGNMKHTVRLVSG